MIQRILIGVTLALGPAVVAAQDPPALVEAYGEGVHAYFSGSVFEAHRLFTDAIDGGIQDPRAYYFRAMTLLRMGRDVEAEADMEAGAHLEARAPSGAYAVDRSIERLQGRDRLALEKVRRRVRFEVEQQRRAEMAQRFEQTQRREAEVLRLERRPTYDEAVQLAGGSDRSGPGNDAPQSPADTPDQEKLPADTATVDAPSTADAAGNANEDPFASETTDAPDETAAAPAVEVGQKVEGTKLLEIIGGIFGEVVEKNLPQTPPIPGGMPPFGPGAGPPGAVPLGEGDPFGGDPFGGAEPTAEPPQSGQVPAPTTEDDPFGGADPFGGNDAAPQEDDPFGAGAAAPDGGSNPPDAGGGESPPKEEDNPFGKDDPFGNADDPFN